MKKAGESISKTILQNIKKRRQDKNYTQEYMAARLHISQNAYSKIELGYSKLTLERCFQIASILEVRIIQLMTPESGRPHPLIFDNRSPVQPKL